MDRLTDRPPVGADAGRSALAELFGSPLGVALGTKAADVAVLVRPAMGKGGDVVRYSRLADNPGGRTITAKRFGSQAP